MESIACAAVGRAESLVDGVIGQVDATVVPRYGGEPTFARLPRLADVTTADVAILGVPFDTGVSYRPAPGSVPVTSESPPGCFARTTRRRTSRRSRRSRSPTPATSA